MNKLLGIGRYGAGGEEDTMMMEAHGRDEDVPAPPAFCRRISPEQMAEQSRQLTEEQLRNLDLYLRDHPEVVDAIRKNKKRKFLPL